jgi:N utilization substance protein B
MKRRTAREKALQALFQVNLSGIDGDDAIANVVEDEKKDPFLLSLVTGVCEHQEEIDQLIKQNLEKWLLSRVANVDKTIIRIAVFEMKYVDEIPVNVSIDEAVELAKTFGDEKSSGFINSVLSKIKAQIDVSPKNMSK